MATATVPPVVPHAQFPVNDLDFREADQPRISLHIAVIQQPIHRWQKPWRHQRMIVLFASTALEMRLRLELEGRIKPGEHVLQVRRAGE